MDSQAAKFSAWLNKIKDDYERVEGRPITITELGRRLGVKQTTISTWINGTRQPSYQNVLELAEKTGDYSILGYFGYALDSIPPGLRSSIDAAAAEIVKAYKDRGVTDFESPLALSIAIEILSRFGWNFSINSG
jgi:transcriptional regulator with XRE-family HTH domain